MLILVTKWFQANSLAFNVPKSKYQVFYGNRIENINIVIQMQNNVLERSVSLWYPGLHVDENLKWHKQIAFVVTNLSRSLGIMGKLSLCYPRDNLHFI